jgi:hypothetical protein
MAFTDSPDTYLADFGVAISAGAVSGLGIFDQPDSDVGGVTISTGYSVLCKTSLFGTLKYGDSLTVGGVAYVVGDNKKLDDGTFCRIGLQLP